MILVTGATGKIGREVVAELIDGGADFRALAPDPAKASLPEGVEVVLGDLSDPSSLAAALEDVASVFLLWAVGSDQTASALIEAIGREPRRVVYLSAMGIGDDPAAELGPILSSHRRLEQLIERSGLEWTFVRAGLAGNTLGWAHDIRADGVVREPFGGVPRALVHERDVAVIATHALTEDGHQGRRYEITGPDVVSGVDQVQAIADAIDRPLRLETLSREQARERLIATMGDAATADSMLDT